MSESISLWSWWQRWETEQNEWATDGWEISFVLRFHALVFYRVSEASVCSHACCTGKHPRVNSAFVSLFVETAIVSQRTWSSTWFITSPLSASQSWLLGKNPDCTHFVKKATRLVTRLSPTCREVWAEECGVVVSFTFLKWWGRIPLVPMAHLATPDTYSHLVLLILSKHGGLKWSTILSQQLKAADSYDYTYS